MNLVYIILIFCIVLFLYLHIFFHLKTSDDLEIYEIDFPTKDKLEEICDLRQPVLFAFNNERILEACQRKTLQETYGAFDIKIRNVKKNVDDDSELYVPLSFNNALQIIAEDTEAKYLVENNRDFLDETSVVKSYKYNDGFLRPYMVADCNYDLIMASANVQTPFRYEMNYRTYLLVTEGMVKIKLAPPKSTKYLNQHKNYEILEFTSPINPYQVQPQYKADFDKIKCLDVTLQKGDILYLPAYWWYSIEFGQQTTLCAFKYKTYMNMVAISPNLIMNLLQAQNVKRNSVQKIDRRKAAALIPTAPLVTAPLVTAPHVTAPHVTAPLVTASLAENGRTFLPESIIPERTLEETIASSPFEEINNNNNNIINNNNNNTPIL
jgi:hypothetical protein